MALFAGRFRRSLTLSSSLINLQRLSSSICPTVPTSFAALCPENTSQSKLPGFQSRNFKSSSIWFQAAARSSFRGGDNEEITEDTILFEGCDYNHWLITMDFPKDPEPTREEKIETYLQTLAKVVGSYEEAKNKMYALSTTTYQGFQCLVTEEMSEKFKGLPGVVFVLPDSYIDPVNKEYGGDKYENGVITPRPPPFQYGRNRGRSGDQNRDYNRREGSPIRSQPGNSGFVNQERNWRPQPSGGMRDNNFPGRGDSVPPFQSNYGQGGAGYSNTQGGSPSGDQRNYGPPQAGNFGPPSGANYGPQAGGGAYGQEAGTNYGPPRGTTYGQQAGGNFGQREAGNYGQGAGRIYGQPAGGNIGQQGSGSFGQQGSGSFGPQGNGNFGQPNAQNYGQPGMANNSQRPGGIYGQGQQAGSSPTGFVQDFQTQGEEQKFRQMEQRGNLQGDQRNYTSTPPNVMDQGKY